MHADVPNHEPSLMLMNCGDARLVRPAAGAWVKCSTANAARVYVSDVAGTSYSSYHTGGGSWEFRW